MRHLLKFLHTMGAIGLMGAIAALLILMRIAPPPTALAGYALMSGAMADIADWLFFPSLAVTLVAGLLAIAANPGFHNAGWAWAKLASGLLMFEGSMVSVVGPIEEEARRSAAMLAGKLDPATVAESHGVGSGALWALLAVTTANVAVGIWRPRFSRIADEPSVADDAAALRAAAAFRPSSPRALRSGDRAR